MFLGMSVSRELCLSEYLRHTSECCLVKTKSRCETRLFGRSRHDEATRWCGRRRGRVLRRRRRILFPEKARQYDVVLLYEEGERVDVDLWCYIKMYEFHDGVASSSSSTCSWRRRSSLQESPTSCQFINSIFTRAAASGRDAVANFHLALSDAYGQFNITTTTSLYMNLAILRL